MAVLGPYHNFHLPFVVHRGNNNISQKASVKVFSILRSAFVLYAVVARHFVTSADLVKNIRMSSLRYVDHTYRDFSRYIEEGGRLIKHKKSEANFPAKLHKMVSDPANSKALMWMVSFMLWLLNYVFVCSV